MPNKFVRKNSTRRKRLIAQALQADAWTDRYQDVRPCANGHESPWRYIKGGQCVRCQAERYQTTQAAD